MAAELRWILLGLSVPLLAAIWWWTARRAARQTSGNAELRESSTSAEPRFSEAERDLAERPPEVRERDWGVPPLEPLHIRTGGFDQVPVLDAPMMVHLDPVTAPAASDTMSAHAEPTEEEPQIGLASDATVTQPALPALKVPGGSASENTGRFNAAAAPAPNPAELQKIVTVRVCAAGESRWPGAELVATLERHSLAFGRYQVFHRKHADGRSLFCVASLVEPGTFDLALMPEQEFRGMTLFAVLPGPAEPVETLEELFETARELAEELAGSLQDGKGVPLTAQRAASIRDDVARFQAALSGS